MTRILVIGRNGQVAGELALTLPTLGEVLCAGRDLADATQPAKVRALVEDFRPQVIVNASAYTAVDKAESDAAAARTLNVDAVALLAELADKMRVPLIHYSTDYVFDGKGQRPWVETDPTGPQGVYAQTKLDGENAIRTSGCAHFIFRTAWVYGHFGANFYKTMNRLAREREELRVVGDQTGSPTWSYMIALSTSQILAQGFVHGSAGIPISPAGAAHNLHEFVRARSGTYHLTAAGECTWYDFAREIFATDPRAAELKCKTVTRITTAEYPTPAKRPANSVLSNEKCFQTFGIRLPDWKQQLAMVQSR
ncbi:MAG: dTDP-4-dehydrorhamnose reductase [Proteobacteria bacterium]|nr:dTDP-4-dehydrorhamnose reductase [Pseudomonadota bacterium]